MINMEVRTHHNVDFFRRDSYRAQISHPWPLFTVPVRSPGPILVFADAAVNQDGMAFGAHQKRLEGEYQHSANWIDAAWLKPAAVMINQLLSRVGKHLQGIAIGARGFRDRENLNVAEILGLHDQYAFSKFCSLQNQSSAPPSIRVNIVGITIIV